MKITHVAPYYPPHIGGVEGVAEKLSEALVKKGHVVEVITSDISQPKGSSAQKGAKKPSIKTNRAFEFAHIPFAPALPFSIYNSLKKSDIIHVHAGIAYYPEASLLAARLLHKPIVMTFHCDTEPSGKFGFLLPLYNRVFLKRVLRAADFVVCLTRDHADIVRGEYGVSESKIRVIPNGIDGQFFGFKPKPIKMASKKSAINLLFVGRIAKQKNLPRLINAVKLLSKKHPVLLRIVGSGEEENKIREMVKDEGLSEKVIFLGAYSKSETAKWKKVFGESDFFVSSSDYEGVPLALMEAMAAGLVVVATNVRGVKEVAKGLAKLTTPDAASLADAIEKLFYKTDVRRSLSKKAKAAVGHLRWEKIAEMYEKVYTEAIK